MKIGSYISELLFQHDEVVLPGLGTFSTIYQPARFLKEQKIVKPPSKIASFSPEPKTGDTLLVNHIAQREGKSRQEVLQYFKNFVKETEHALDAGEKITFEKLGVFYKDTAGGMVFDPNQDVNYMAIGNEMSDISTPRQKTPEEISTQLTPESKEKETVVRTPIPTIPQKNTEPKPSKPMTETKKKESKEVKPLPPALKWAAIIIIPLLVILIIVFLNFNFFFGDDGLFRKSDPVVVEQPVDPEITEITEEPVREPLVEETYVPEPEPKPEPKPEISFDPYAEPPQADPFRPAYFIIVGSFEDINNAEKLALELRKDGNQLASILRMTPSGFHRTYSGFYYDLNEAKAEKNKLKEELREIAWILHR